jgi:hypothetical protein
MKISFPVYGILFKKRTWWICCTMQEETWHFQVLRESVSSTIHKLLYNDFIPYKFLSAYCKVSLGSHHEFAGDWGL